jgi:hypothetical protein
MFELIPIEVFTGIVREHFTVLDGQYIDDQSPSLLRDLCSRFDEVYEPCFLIIDNESGRPMSTEIITDRKTADDCARVCGPHASVGILLMTR